MFSNTSAPASANLRGWIDQCDYRLCESIGQLDDYLARVTAEYGVGSDLETNTLNVFAPSLRIVGVNLSVARHSGLYIPVGHLEGYEHNLPLERVAERLQALDRGGIRTRWYHYPFDGEVLQRCLGWEPACFDEVEFAVIFYDNSQKTFGLKAAVRRILGREMPTYGEVTGLSDEDEPRTFAEVHPRDCVIYGCADADLTAQLWHEPGVQAALRTHSAVYTLELALMPVFRRMIRNGVYLDDERFAALETELRADLVARADAIHAVLGPFNLHSPKQLVPKLQAAGVTLVEETKGSKKGAVTYSTGREVLERLVQTPGAPAILTDIVKYRRAKAYLDNYVMKCRGAVAHFGPHVHFPFRQIGAPTGRMSAGGEQQRKGRPKYEKGFVDLNIQSFPNPKRDPDALDLRSGVLPDDPTCPDLGPDPAAPDPWVLLDLDFSLFQVRVAANLSREPVWVEALSRGKDIHLINAQIIYEDLTLTKEANKDKRARGKTWTFAALFLASAETLALQAGVSEKAAERMNKAFWAGVPRLDRWIQETDVQAAREKAVSTFLGRRRPLDEFYVASDRKNARWLREKGKREAVNTKVQGGEAEVFKIALVKIDKLKTARGWHDRLQDLLYVHDEILFRCRQSLLAEAIPAIQQVILDIQIRDWPVPWVTEVATGPNWGTALTDWPTQVLPAPTPLPTPTGRRAPVHAEAPLARPPFTLQHRPVNGTPTPAVEAPPCRLITRGSP